MERNLLKTAFVIAGLFFAHQTAIQAQNKSILTLADDYSATLRKYQGQKKRTSAENVLKKGKLVDEKSDEMENLNASDYALLEKKMKGFVVNRNEVVFVVPDVKFFGNLSRRYGTPADIAFFNLLREIRPDSVWAAYIEQQTDYSGCTIYGNGLLTRLYGKAVQFKRNYRKAYTSDVNKEIDSILNEFSDNPCSCGNRNGILREYRLFIKTFPKDKNTREIRKRLVKLQKSASLRVNCISG